MKSLTSILLLATSSLAIPTLQARQTTEYAALSYDPDSCPGYTASNVQKSDTQVTMDLKLAGEACNAFSAVRDLAFDGMPFYSVANLIGPGQPKAMGKIRDR